MYKARISLVDENKSRASAPNKESRYVFVIHEAILALILKSVSGAP
jgi:hypothetical protein